jgi:hypothetical protein
LRLPTYDEGVGEGLGEGEGEPEPDESGDGVGVVPGGYWKPYSAISQICPRFTVTRGVLNENCTVVSPTVDFV